MSSGLHVVETGKTSWYNRERLGSPIIIVHGSTGTRFPRHSQDLTCNLLCKSQPMHERVITHLTLIVQ